MVTAQQNDSIIIHITNLSNSINSKYQEYAPVISADASLLMFTTKRPIEGKKKQKEILEQIWSSEFNETSKIWETPKALPENINNPSEIYLILLYQMMDINYYYTLMN